MTRQWPCSHCTTRGRRSGLPRRRTHGGAHRPLERESPPAGSPVPDERDTSGPHHRSGARVGREPDVQVLVHASVPRGRVSALAQRYVSVVEELLIPGARFEPRHRQILTGYLDGVEDSLRFTILIHQLVAEVCARFGDRDGAAEHIAAAVDAGLVNRGWLRNTARCCAMCAPSRGSPRRGWASIPAARLPRATSSLAATRRCRGTATGRSAGAVRPSPSSDRTDPRLTGSAIDVVVEAIDEGSAQDQRIGMEPSLLPLPLGNPGATRTNRSAQTAHEPREESLADFSRGPLDDTPPNGGFIELRETGLRTVGFRHDQRLVPVVTCVNPFAVRGLTSQ